MKSVIRKWGNSPALRLPGSLLAEAGLALDQPVLVCVVEGSIRIERVRRKPAYRLEDLLAEARANARHGEASWGPPRGHEAW